MYLLLGMLVTSCSGLYQCHPDCYLLTSQEFYIINFTSKPDIPITPSQTDEALGGPSSVTILPGRLTQCNLIETQPTVVLVAVAGSLSWCLLAPVDTLQWWDWCCLPGPPPNVELCVDLSTHHIPHCCPDTGHHPPPSPYQTDH